MSEQSPTVAERFATYLSALEPPAARQRAAEGLPALLRAHLESSSTVRLAPQGTLLVGSYRRHTAIHDIKDVDIAVFVDPSYRDQPINIVLTDLARAIDDFSKKYGERRGGVSHTDQRRSIRVDFDRDGGFRLDVVPLIATGPNVDADLLIPDRASKRWSTTRSVGYLRTFSDLNAKSGGRLVPLVKLLKAWRAHADMDRKVIKSFWLEALIVDEVRAGRIRFDGVSYAELVASAFEMLHRRCDQVRRLKDRVCVIPDPTLPDSNVAKLWTRTGFDEFGDKLADARRASAEALVADQDVATRKWRRVFGPAFAPSTWDWLLPATEVGAAIGVFALVVLVGRKR